MTSSQPINFTQERENRRPLEQTILGKHQESIPPSVVASQTQRKRGTAQQPIQGPRCSSCHSGRDDVKFLLPFTRGILLCDRCIEVCNEILHDEGVSTDAERVSPTSLFSSKRSTQYSCSFCSSVDEGVARLIAMPHELFICNICVGTCNAAVARHLGNESLLEQTEKGQYAQEPERVTVKENHSDE